MRAIPDGFKATYLYEQERLADIKDPLKKLVLNRFVMLQVLQIVYIAAIYVIFGHRTFGFHLLYSFIMMIEFEAVNYIEHYGLHRKLMDDNVTYEKVQLKHSWNAP